MGCSKKTRCKKAIFHIFTQVPNFFFREDLQYNYWVVHSSRNTIDYQALRKQDQLEKDINLEKPVTDKENVSEEAHNNNDESSDNYDMEV